MREADIKDFTAFLEEFQGETDRGAALVGAALLDQKLSDTLRGFMVQGKVSDQLLDDRQPLGSLAARINAAYALGLIDDHERHECDFIRRIRNEFAHRIHGTTFADQKIRSYCEQLNSDLPGGRAAFKDNPRGVFINAVILQILRLTYRAEWVADERRTTRIWP